MVKGSRPSSEIWMGYTYTETWMIFLLLVVYNSQWGLPPVPLLYSCYDWYISFTSRVSRRKAFIPGLIFRIIFFFDILVLGNGKQNIVQRNGINFETTEDAACSALKFFGIITKRDETQ